MVSIQRALYVSWKQQSVSCSYQQNVQVVVFMHLKAIPSFFATRQPPPYTIGRAEQGARECTREAGLALDIARLGGLLLSRSHRGGGV